MAPPAARIDSLDAQRVQLIQLIANTLPALLAYVDEQGRYVWAKPVDRAALQRVIAAHPG